jgi:hypothetical protein
MSTTILKSIKAVLNFRRMAADLVVTNSYAICTKMDNNPNFAAPNAPAPPVDIPTLRAATDALATVNSAALGGGKEPLARKSHQKEIVVRLLIQLGHYVEANCKDDMTIFLSSGFTAVSTIKSKTPPVSDSFRKVDQGENSGEMKVIPMRYPGAGSYEVRWAPIMNGVPGVWTSHPILNIKAATTISGLTPGTTYVFQVRALTQAGYTDYSDSVTRVAT